MANCKHIRIVNNNQNGNIEKFINSIEKYFNIDIRTLPQWKEIIAQLYETDTLLKRRIQIANNRKKCIVQKLLRQNTKLSTFELTEHLCRTASKWENMQVPKSKTPKVSIKLESESESHLSMLESIFGEQSEVLSKEKYTAHPNSEMDNSELINKTDDELDFDLSHLPAHICINTHKTLSPLTSNISGLALRSMLDNVSSEAEFEINEWDFLKPTKAIKVTPEIIYLDELNTQQQIITFSLTNCSTEFMYIRFKRITDASLFRNLKVQPVRTIKLLPGLSAKYKLNVKFIKLDDVLKSGLFFKVGHCVYTNSATEALIIPIESKLSKLNLFVSEIVSTPPAYLWHIKTQFGFPTGIIKIRNEDHYKYNLRMVKREYNFDDSEDIASNDVIGPSSESIEERVDDEELLINEFSNPVFDPILISKSVEIKSFMEKFVEEIINTSMKAFYIERMYLEVKPSSKYNIPVYLRKPEHIGLQHSIYDLNFHDPDTDEVITTKTIRVQGEVLDSPIKVTPILLDMSTSLITHGYCEDSFTINNTNKVFPVMIKIKLTTKMRKIFRVDPMAITIPGGGKVDFYIRVCSRTFKELISSFTPQDELAYFIIKIVCSGCKAIYESMPPIFYEIIIPCSKEFKSIYGNKYFNEFYDGSP